MWKVCKARCIGILSAFLFGGRGKETWFYGGCACVCSESRLMYVYVWCVPMVELTWL